MKPYTLCDEAMNRAMLLTFGAAVHHYAKTLALSGQRCDVYEDGRDITADVIAALTVSDLFLASHKKRLPAERFSALPAGLVRKALDGGWIEAKKDAHGVLFLGLTNKGLQALAKKAA